MTKRQTIQWTKEKQQRDKQRPTKHTHNERYVTQLRYKLNNITKYPYLK